MLTFIFVEGCRLEFYDPHLLEAIDSLQSGTLKSISRTLIYVVPFGGTFYSAWVIYYFYCDQSKITEVRNNLRQDIREKG